MIIKDLETRISNFIIGQQVEGTVAAILPPVMSNHNRYVVETPERVLLDVEVPLVENLDPINYRMALPVPQLARGEHISMRSKRVKAFEDGQTL